MIKRRYTLEDLTDCEMVPDDAYADEEWVVYKDHERDLRSENSKLAKNNKELERRVRWLESILLEAEEAAWEEELRDCANAVSEAVLIYPDKTGGEKKVKPTPEDFK